VLNKVKKYHQSNSRNFPNCAKVGRIICEVKIDAFVFEGKTLLIYVHNLYAFLAVKEFKKNINFITRLDA
jgi:hypothetical protein